MVNTTYQQTASALLLLLISLSAMALTSDRKQPIQIQADYVQIDKKTGISEYRGNVQLQQGSMRITGDWITIHQPGGELQRIIVEGKPATFTQQPDDQKEPIFAQAGRMEYQAQTERIILQQDALVKQGKQTFAGNHIVYNTRNSTVVAEGSDDQQKRVRAVIIPRQDKAKTP